MYQVLDGCLIEVTTMEELSLGWQKGGCSRLIEVGDRRGLISHSLFTITFGL